MNDRRQGYLLGGVCWFAIPFSLASSLGLACLALKLPISAQEGGVTRMKVRLGNVSMNVARPQPSRSQWQSLRARAGGHPLPGPVLH
jgi:hypothetical protein